MNAAIRELQRLKQAVVAGAGANSNISVPGIATADVLVGVVAFNPTGPAVTMPAASITSAGNIQTATSTSGMTLIVTYLDVA